MRKVLVPLSSREKKTLGLDGERYGEKSDRIEAAVNGG